MNINGAEQAEPVSGKQLEDLLGMIRNAEKSKISFWNNYGFFFSYFYFLFNILFPH